jgi:uroporphyrinogen decarboxylase
VIKINSRQRVLKAYAHQEPDRVPICIGGVAQKFSTPIYNQVKDILKITDKTEKEGILDELNSVIHYHPKVLEYFNVDFREIHIHKIPPLKVYEDGSWKHELGIKIRASKTGETANFISHPLKDADIGDLKKYRWPNPDRIERVKGLKKRGSRLISWD